MTPFRPSPEALLRQLENQARQADRGRLKLFLGYSPRSGKSLRMFDEARRRKARGQDVVVGAVQLKGADEVSDYLQELEIVPTLADGALDTAAIIARQPQICVVDELARDSAKSGSPHHRWQDIVELRRHGITVLAAINLQHIAEFQEIIAGITGKRTLETVPEAFIHSADELVIVDVPGGAGSPRSPLDTHQLARLREEALLLAAEVVEHQLRRYMDAHGIHESWGTQERILVCITPQPSARLMLESGARVAATFHGQLLALHVHPPGAGHQTSAAMKQTLDTARQCGAQLAVREASDTMAEILSFAREQRVTQLFVGHSRQPFWKFWAPNPLKRLIQGAAGMDIRIFPSPPSP